MHSVLPLHHSSIAVPAWPPLLHQGDTVAMVALSSARTDMQERVRLAIQVLQTWGLKVVLGKHIYDKHYRFSGKDADRLADLQWALDDAKVKATIVCNGGYGSTRIVDKVDFAAMQLQPKWFVGFSDTTTLLLKLHQLNVVSVHGPVGPHFAKAEQASSVESLRQLLFEGHAKASASAHALNRTGEAKAPVVGGNLTMICNNIGTPSALDTQDKILVIEDVGEHPYRLDRLLVQLKRMGQLRHLAGLVIGKFTGTYMNPEDPFAASVESMVKEHVHEYDYPIAFGFPIGHEPPNTAFPHGAIGRLGVSMQGANLCFKG